MFRLFIYVGLFYCAFAFDDVEKKCQPGERIVSMKRESDGKAAQRLTAECGPMKPSADAVKSPSCKEGKPLSCNGKLEGCPSGSWLGGINFYQLDPASSVDLMVPLCCTSESVTVDQCSDTRLNSAYSAIDSSVGDNRVYQGVTCWALEDSSSKPPKLIDAIFKVGICKYNVQAGAGGASPPPSSNTPPPAANTPPPAASTPPPAASTPPPTVAQTQAPAVTQAANTNQTPPKSAVNKPPPVSHVDGPGNGNPPPNSNSNPQKGNGSPLPFRKGKSP